MSRTYELSLSRDYVSDWGVIEAVRELIQNAIDEGNYDIGIDKHNVLHIINHGSVLTADSLILGNSGKREDVSKIGQFGEGYKLALLVLTRMGKDVVVYNGGARWYPRFKKSKKFGCEVLVIDEEVNPNDIRPLDFEINGLMYNELSEIVDAFPLIFEKVSPFEVKETGYGEIIMDKEQAGKFYVQGLPIFEDKTFKYGYNFHADVVSLDRDRKSVNLYELKDIASKMIAQVEEPEFIETNLTNSNADSEYLRRNKVELDDKAVTMMQEYFTEKYEIEEDSIVITSDDRNLKRELESMGHGDKVVEVPNASVKRIMNTGRETSEILAEAEMKKEKVDEIEGAYWQITYDLAEHILKAFSKHKGDYSEGLLDSILDCIQDSYTDFELIRDEVRADVLKGEFTVSGKNGR